MPPEDPPRAPQLGADDLHDLFGDEDEPAYELSPAPPPPHGREDVSHEDTFLVEDPFPGPPARTSG